MRPAALLSALAPLLLNLAISPKPVCGQGHPFDVHPAVSDGRLTTNQSVYADAFDEVDGAIFTENPGFETGTGALAAGDQLGFALVDKLWYWNGEALADPPPDTAVSISRGPQAVTVDALSAPQPGFTLATAGESGFIHVHPSYTLESSEPAAGVYGLVLELTSPQYKPSDPFVIALGWFGDSLTLEQYNAGVAAIGAAALLPPLPGDANLDGRVDLSDFGILKQHFGAGTQRSEGDFNGDGQVDLSDFGILKANFGSSANTTAVPEPATWTLALAALMAVSGWRSIRPWSRQRTVRVIVWPTEVGAVSFRRSFAPIVACAGLTLFGPLARAQDVDVAFEVVGGALSVPEVETGRLFLTEFPQPPDPLAYFADEPGFEAEAEVLGAGDKIDAEVLSGLLFWNGSAASPAPAGVLLEIAKGPLTLANLSGSGPLAGFSFATADQEGGVHQHLGFSLRHVDPEMPGAFWPGGPAGAYGLLLRLTSPQHAASQPLLIAFNNGLPEDAFTSAATALAQQAGVPVPEPAAWLLAALGSMAAMTMRRRR